MVKKKKKILITILILLCVAAAVGAFCAFGRRDKDDEAVENKNNEMTVSSSEEEETARDGIRIPGYPTITIKAETTDVEMNLMNPEGNPCSFVYEIVLSDTEEVLYTSEAIAPGETITNVTLSRALPAGEYDAVVRISTMSLEDGSSMNGANVNTVIKAE